MDESGIIMDYSIPNKKKTIFTGELLSEGIRVKSMTMNKQKKIRDGFQGEKLISIPTSVLTKALPGMIPNQPYVTHIGYFPNALYHYRLRKYGCEDNILFYCLKGKGYYQLDHKKYELKANQFVIIPATKKLISYWADPDDPWTIYWIHFTGTDLDLFNRTLGLGKILDPVYIPHNEEGLRIWNKMYDSLAMGYSIENLINANLCLNHLIATFIFPQKHSPSFANSQEKTLINQTIHYMKSNLDKKICMEDLVGLHHRSVSYFSKLFRQSTGMAPIDYFIHLKMQHACHLLNTTDLRIKQIAAILGYEDPYYFSRLFKKNNNNSPEEFRMICRDLF